MRGSVSRIISNLDGVLYDFDNIPQDKEQFDLDVINDWKEPIKDAIEALTDISYYVALLNDGMDGR